jgi:hypothetical protein
MLSQVIDGGRRICELVVTLFLFTKSDVLTGLIPIVRTPPCRLYILFHVLVDQTLFVLAAAPHPHLARIPETIVWMWMHILKHDISNQIQDPEEDKMNKPDRPLPSGRISTQNAAYVRWILVPICLAFSAKYGGQALASSACVEAISIWYNHFGGDKGWISKNLLTASGYICVEIGAIIVAGT